MTDPAQLDTPPPTAQLAIEYKSDNHQTVTDSLLNLPSDQYTDTELFSPVSSVTSQLNLELLNDPPGELTPNILDEYLPSAVRQRDTAFPPLPPECQRDTVKLQFSNSTNIYNVGSDDDAISLATSEHLLSDTGTDNTGSCQITDTAPAPQHTTAPTQSVPTKAPKNKSRSRKTDSPRPSRVTRSQVSGGKERGRAGAVSEGDKKVSPPVKSSPRTPSAGQSANRGKNRSARGGRGHKYKTTLSSRDQQGLLPCPPFHPQRDQRGLLGPHPGAIPGTSNFASHVLVPEGQPLGGRVIATRDHSPPRPVKDLRTAGPGSVPSTLTDQSLRARAIYGHCQNEPCRQTFANQWTLQTRVHTAEAKLLMCQAANQRMKTDTDTLFNKLSGDLESANDKIRDLTEDNEALKKKVSDFKDRSSVDQRVIRKLKREIKRVEKRRNRRDYKKQLLRKLLQDTKLNPHGYEETSPSSQSSSSESEDSN